MKDEMLRRFCDDLKYYEGHRDTEFRHRETNYMLDHMFEAYLYGGDEFDGFSTQPTIRDLAVVIWTLYGIDIGLKNRWATIEEIETLITPFCKAVKEDNVDNITKWMDDNLAFEISNEFASYSDIESWALHSFEEYHIEEVAKHIFHVTGENWPSRWKGYVSVAP